MVSMELVHVVKPSNRRRRIQGQIGDVADYMLQFEELEQRTIRRERRIEALQERCLQPHDYMRAEFRLELEKVELRKEPRDIKKHAPGTSHCKIEHDDLSPAHQNI